MKKLIKYSLLVLLSSVSIAYGASSAIINRRLARLTGHIVATPVTTVKKLAVAKTNAEIQAGPQELAQDDLDHINSVIDGLVVEKNIWECAQDGDVEGFKKLVQKPEFNANAHDNSGKTPLMWAVINNHLEVVKSLVKCGADVNATNLHRRWVTPLMTAVLYGRLEMVKYLVGLQDPTGRLIADVNAKDMDGWTVLIWASVGGHLAIVQYLMGLQDTIGKTVIDVNVKDSRYGSTALIYAAKNSYSDIIRFLVEKCGADVAVRDYDGKIAANYVIAGGHKKIGLYLLLCSYLQHQAQAVHYVARTVSALVSRL